jgi:hypothetical protein
MRPAFTERVPDVYPLRDAVSEEYCGDRGRARIWYNHI